MLMGCAWTKLKVEGLMDLKQSLGIDESRWMDMGADGRC